ncbi:MAG: bifunctional folylpolyglutamate synthase/dihydrofolate synthase [Dethiobacteria bacterium]|nr:bifunctional folylpolyglutamate synthase/dihydrofolate synthase [Bacillota bacterium]
MNTEKRYEEALNWIHGLGRFGIKPGLERITALLEMLGNPHHNISFVHIGGTNGKGSTAAMLASILRTAGLNIGLYTSPYLLSFTNRMAVNGSDINQGDLADLVDEIKPLIDQILNDPELGQPTEFEVVTVLALTYFARQKVDLVVLEVGLGGRLDATNVVIPILSIITNISLEHTEILGDTITKIAGEKAGIIKPGRPLLTASSDEEVLKLFEDRCHELRAPLYRVYPPVEQASFKSEHRPVAISQDITPEGQYFSYRGFKWGFDHLFIRLRGKYQLENACTALAAAEIISGKGFPIDEEAVRKGLAETVWPGRLELMQNEPLLIMDGAHNPAAIEKLAEAFPLYFDYRRLILIFGMLADKDMASMLNTILPIADIVIFTRPLLPRAAEPESVAAYAIEKLGYSKECYIVGHYGEALEKALGIAAPGDAILVTGSLYTVSDIRAYWVGHRR